MLTNYYILYRFGFWFNYCYFSLNDNKKSKFMSPEIRDFSFMIDEQFELVDHNNQGFWGYILSFFK